MITDITSSLDPIAHILARYPAMVIDGAMATELEARGHNLNDALWSAKLLLENPQVIYDVHHAYFKAGADCATTCSYQASVAGFAQKGISREKAKSLIQKSVSLAQKARDNFWKEANPKNRPFPVIAGSIGSYGAFLADGSEYRGDYQVGHEVLTEFHRPRMEWLLEAGVDLLAIETLPSFAELRVLLDLLAQYPKAVTWFSFSIRDAQHLCDGTPLSRCVELLNNSTQVAAIGVNCTALENVIPVIAHIKTFTQKPIIVYPNSGETYDAQSKTWHGHACGHADFGTLARQWLNAGAKLIGGCCRTTPEDIRQIAKALR